MSLMTFGRYMRRSLFRRKRTDLSLSGEQSELVRVLNTFDLTALGIGCTIGSGIYIIIGSVARNTAGPSVVLSFLVAGIASILAGLCYAEFGARVPKAGSAYIYSYVTVGELWAFIIGWNLILEYVIGTASIANACSVYVGSLVNDSIHAYLLECLPMHVTFFATYFDAFALAITLVMTAILCFGIKESSILNNVFTVVNLVVIAYIIICGFFKVNIDNWRIPQSQVPPTPPGEKGGFGKGGFFPFGVGGMLTGAATCFYAFVGFDVIATTGEEVINPERAIPFGIIFSLTACGLAYIGVAVVLTLIVPYYTLAQESPLAVAFEHIGWYPVQYVIIVGAIASLTTCLLTTMIPMPRIIFAMARDGLLFKFLAHVNDRFKTAIPATIVAGVISGIMAGLFPLDELVQMMSIGTLLAYTLVAVCVLILRYEHNGIRNDLVGHDDEIYYSLCCPGGGLPTRRSSRLVKACVGSLCFMTVVLGLLEKYLQDYIFDGKWWAILVLTIPVVILIALIILISRQPCQLGRLTFQVPCVPVLPAVSIMMNIYLMLKLNDTTWIRFGVWMALGFAIYFGYGIRHATSKKKPETRSVQVASGDESTSAESSRPASVDVNERSHLIVKYF